MVIQKSMNGINILLTLCHSEKVKSFIIFTQTHYVSHGKSIAKAVSLKVNNLMLCRYIFLNVTGVENKLFR